MVPIFFGGAEPSGDFGRGHYEEHFCDIILNFDQWFKSYLLKYFLTAALVALLFTRVVPFEKLWERPLWGTLL